MPTPVAPQSSTVVLPPAAKAAPDAQAAAVLDFAALLFAQTETPAAPGLTIAATVTAESASLLAAPPDEPAGEATPTTAEGLQALLAAIVLPGAAALPLPPPQPTVLPEGSASAVAAPAVGEAATSDGLDATGAALLGKIGKGQHDEAANFSDFSSQDLAGASDKHGIGSHTGLTAHGPAATDKSTAAGPASVRVETPINDSRWSADFGQRIVWLAKQDIQSAQLSINPPNLGPIDVSIKLGADQATAVFSSPHADVREALEAALPRLREMLAGAGIQLGDAQVNGQSQQQAGYQPRPGHGRDDAALPAGGAILHDAADASSTGLSRARIGGGLVDTFA